MPPADKKITLTLDNYKEYLSFDAFIDRIDIETHPLGNLDGNCQILLQCTPKQSVSFENVTARFYLETYSTGWTNLGNSVNGYSSIVVPSNGITSKLYNTMSLIDKNLDKSPKWYVRIIEISGYVIQPNS